ncbi:hypothetical protein QQ045_012663 [Rhodiola kirilowii]
MDGFVGSVVWLLENWVDEIWRGLVGMGDGRRAGSHGFTLRAGGGSFRHGGLSCNPMKKAPVDMNWERRWESRGVMDEKSLSQAGLGAFRMGLASGGSRDVILKVVLRCPEMLVRNMDKDLVPSLEFLRSILQTDENVLLVIGRCHWLLRFNLPAILGPNVVSLRDVGMSDAMILLFLKSRPTALLSSAARFREVVVKVTKMGFDPEKYSFFEAINVFLSVNEKTWERKVEIFKKWGWSDADVLSAFMKQPRCMLQSEKKVEGIMNYLVNTMDFDPSFAAQSPNVLMCSLKKRIIPRCSIIRHLLLNGVVTKKDFKFSSALVVSEPIFMSIYVARHKDLHPELLDLYMMHKEDFILITGVKIRKLDSYIMTIDSCQFVKLIMTDAVFLVPVSCKLNPWLLYKQAVQGNPEATTIGQN